MSMDVNDSCDYPKVLIIGYFNLKKPTGITTNNLFKGWPRGRIAIASYNKLEEMFTPYCADYYQLGSSEVSYIFPFNLVLQKGVSKSYSNVTQVNIKDTGSIQKNTQRKIVAAISRFLNYISLITGMFLIKTKYRISNSFLSWINEFSPDIIYATVEDINRIDYIIDIKKLLDKKIVIHIMDDWIHTLHYYTLFPKYWGNRLTGTFVKLLNYSDLNLAISEKMAEEYQYKYKRAFYPFHNPINIAHYSNIGKQLIKDSTFVFVYAGKINEDTIIPIRDFAWIIKNLRNELDISFRIYTTSSNDLLIRYLGDDAEHYYFGSIPYEKIPSLLSSADGLLLPLSFNEKSTRYTRLSMPTKVTEYMASKTPIFLYAPDELAVTEYLKKSESAFIVSYRNDLKKSIQEFISRAKLRQHIATNAYRVVCDSHDIESINKQLHELLFNLNR